MSEDQLFKDFPAVTAKEWKQKIQADLKGADYNDTLIWESQEGINVKPFYSAEDLEDASLGITHHPATWNIGQWILADDPKLAKKKCQEALENGVESLIIGIVPEIVSAKNPFSQVDLKDKQVFLEVGSLSAQKFKSWLTDLRVENDKLYILHDIIGNLAATGNWFHSMEDDFSLLEELLVAMPDTKIAAVDMSRYQNAGANRIQQLAYALAHAKEYLDRFGATGLRHITFKISVDTNYFFEIAKLKAIRILWTKLMAAVHPEVSYHLLALPSKRNKSLYDYNVNMLRTTTECMSAILGGADTVYNLPYDHVYHQANDFADRIARNQLLILKNESYFDKVSNPASGSYYIESITNQMVDKAWNLYEQITAAGGFLKQLKQHKIQNKIRESAQKQQEAFDMGSEVLVGSNKYPIEGEQMGDQIQKDPFLVKANKKTLIEPILEKRLAESLEKNRLDHE